MLSTALDFNNNFLNQIIYHCIRDDDFIKKIRPVVPLTIFKTREKELLIKIVFDYYDEYKCAPKDNFYDIFKDLEKTLSDDMYQKCIKLIGLLKDITGSNSQYILNTINDAIKHFRLEEASVDFALLIKEKKYDDAKSVILKAIKEKVIDEPYYDFFKDQSFIEKRTTSSSYKMKTKIDKLDEVIGGFNPGWLITLLAPKGTGKTWSLLELSVAGVLQGLNVLFISLEMGKFEIDNRLDMMMGFMTSKKKSRKTDVMKKVGENWIVVNESMDSIYDIDKVINNRRKIKKIGGGNLKVIAFNWGRTNYLDVERFMDELEEKEGFYTDLLVIDYLGLMKETDKGQEKKSRISSNCEGLKELAGKKNLIALTAMQGNRTAMKAKVFHPHMVADDIDTIFNSDLVLAYCQTPTEEKQNKHRIYVGNFRHGRQHVFVGVIRDLNIGQIALDTYEVKDTPEEETKTAGMDY